MTTNKVDAGYMVQFYDHLTIKPINFNIVVGKKNNLITSATLFMIPGTSNSGIIRIPLTLANSMISRTSSGVYVREG